MAEIHFSKEVEPAALYGHPTVVLLCCVTFFKAERTKSMELAIGLRRAALLCPIVVMAGLSATVPAQMPSATRDPAFEVSVVRVSKPDAQGANLNLGEDRLRAQNLTLQALLQFAYKLSSGSDDQIIGGPKWMKSTRFDLEGKLDGETAAKVSKMKNDERLETLRGMLKALLADRFQLKVHQEMRTLPVVRMQAIGETKLVKFEIPPEGSTDSKSWQGLRNDGHGHIEGRGADLKMLASVLAFQPEIGGRLVVDQTGLPEHARFTFELKWTPEGLGGTDTDSNVPGMSLFAAMQEELGLKLIAGKGPVDVLIVGWRCRTRTDSSFVDPAKRTKRVVPQKQWWRQPRLATG